MRRLSVAALLGGLILLTGCMRMGPEYATPDLGVAVPADYQHTAADSARAAGELGRWWESFGQTRLNGLVDRALERNWDLRKAAAQVREAGATLVSTGAARWPEIDATAQFKRQQNGSSSNLGEYDTHSLSLAASYEVDLWGRVSQTTEAALAELWQAEETRLSTAQTLAASVSTAYFNVGVLAWRLEINQRRVESFRQSLEVVEGRYLRGLAAALEYHQAKRSLAQAQATIPLLRQELGQAQQQLAILAGDYPKSDELAPGRALDMTLPPPVPVGLPSSLLNRRPDLKAAEAKLKALNARVGAALAARFPTLSLTGNLGYSSTEVEQLFTPGAFFWNLAAGLTRPLFDAGKLAAQQDAAQARFDAQAATYAQSVLTAFGEVEGALLTRQQRLERQTMLDQALAEAKVTLDTATQRYQRGLTDYLNVLEAQQTRYDLEDSLAQNWQALINNRITLYRALGGGWPGLKPLVAPSEEL